MKITKRYLEKMIREEIEYFVYDHRNNGDEHPVNKRTYNTKDSARKAKDRLDSKHGSAIHSVGQRSKTKKESFRDPIDPMGQEKNKEDLINDLRDNLISCLHRIEVEQKIDYELVMLIDNALERTKTITGKEPFQP